MKKLVVIALVFALACTFVFANGGTEAKADTIESKIANGQKLSDAELLELAKKRFPHIPSAAVLYSSPHQIPLQRSGFC